MEKIEKTEQEWKELLSTDSYRICRQKGTEPPFTGTLLNNKESGEYQCICCGHPLFSSEHKFDSGSGWPSFYDVVNNDALAIEEDFSHGMHRVEVLCKRCNAHLGHVFPDGPAPTHQRYCINSLSLQFKKK